RCSAMAPTWRADRPEATTMKSAKLDFPWRSMTTMSSALSSSRDFSMSPTSSLATGGLSWSPFSLRAMALTLRWLTQLPAFGRHELRPSAAHGFRCRADQGGRQWIEPAVDEGPGGRLGRRQKPPGFFREPGPGKAPRRLGSQRPETIGRPRPDCNRYEVKDLLPGVPAVDLDEVVGAHQPDEAMAGKAPCQLPERGGGMAGAEPRLDVGDLEAGMAGDGPGAFQPVLERRHPGRRLQRVLRADQPPDLVEPEAGERRQADLAMPLGGRGERPARQPHAPGGAAGAGPAAALARAEPRAPRPPR